MYLNLLIASLAIASISYTITQTFIFQSLRLFICSHSNFFGKLISCPYCLSHYISFPIVFYYYKFSIEYFILVFASITLSSIWIGMISRTIDFIPTDG